MDELKRTDGVPIMRRIILPMRNPPPRNWWKIAVWVIAFFWLWSGLRYSYEIVEIDDGSAPGFGPYSNMRFVDGHTAEVTMRVPIGDQKSPATIVLAPVRSWKWTVEYRVRANRDGIGQILQLAIPDRFFGAQCVAIIRWHAGEANFDGCRNRARHDAYM